MYQEEKACDKRQQQHIIIIIIIINRWCYSPMQTFTSLKDISQSALFFDLSFQFAILYFYKLNNTNIFGEFQPVCKLFPLTGISRQSYRSIRYSVVGKVTRCGLYGPEIESPWGKIFRPRPDRPWGRPSILDIGYGVFPGSKAAEAWR